MVENSWLPASETKEKIHAAYVQITGMPIIPAIRTAIADLRGFVDRADASDQDTWPRLEALVAAHATASAFRAMTAIQLCEGLIFHALTQGGLQAKPSGKFAFYPSSGRGVGIGLYGRAGTIPARFWEAFRASEDKHADWLTGTFTFGRNEVGSHYGLASGVEFDCLGLDDLSHELARLLRGGQDGGAKQVGTKSANPTKRRGRPKGAGGYVKADEPLLLEMQKLIEQNPGMSPHAAAYKVVDRAPGNATDETKVRRLSDQYREKILRLVDNSQSD